jgi:hypothetical protein
MELFLQFSRELGRNALPLVFFVLFATTYIECSREVIRGYFTEVPHKTFAAGVILLVAYEFFIYSEIQLKQCIDLLFL